MKKPITKTKFWKVFKAISPVLKVVPGVGPLVQNVVDHNSTPEGVIDDSEATSQLVSLAILVALVILVITGVISFEEAEQAKEFILE